MSFNKIKNLANSVEEIEKAISTSDKLKLSEDRTKVSRITEIIETRNADDCTIYVEALPTTATHDWVRKTFETYGPVAYVSLPKFRSSKKIKEFAFVEFENRAGLMKTIAAYRHTGCLLNMESDPEKLYSVSSYVKEQQQVVVPPILIIEDSSGIVEKMETTSSTAVNNNEDEEDGDKDGLSNIDDEQSESAVTTSEVMGDSTDVSDADSMPIGGPANKRRKLDADEPNNTSTDKEIIPDDDDSKKRKVRRKKNSSKNLKPTIDNQKECLTSSIKITTKLEWKRLRNKYLNHQREQIREMKKQLWAQRKSTRPAAILPPPQKEKKIIPNTRNINFYGAIKETKEEDTDDTVPPPAPANKLLNKKPSFNFVPGIIVKVHFDEPCVDVKDFKADMRQHQFVKYVDVNEGDFAAFVRVENARSAPTLIKYCAPRKCQILTGETEQAYWDKITIDWEQKITKAVKIKPKRGREKITKTIGNHVRFDD